MLKRVLFMVFLFGVLVSPRAMAQSPCSTSTASPDVICTIPQVYGPAGLANGGALAPVGAHQGHFENDFQQNLAPLSSAVASQLSFLPLASPSSGLSFVFDKALGVFVASNDSYGPILSERAGTVGRHRLYLGVSYQYFNFGSVDGLSLKNLPVAYLHQDDCDRTSTGCNPPPPTQPVTCSVNGGVTSSTGNFLNTGGCSFVRDYIQTDNRIDLKLHQTTMFASFGLTNRVDVSVAIPVVDVLMRATSDATIIPNSMSGLHVFSNPNTATCTASVPPAGSSCYAQNFATGRASTGIGDVTFRVKGTVFKGEHNGVAAGVDVRAPSGDALNFQGTGAWGTRVFGIWSYSGRFSPHVNAGYEWNGSSILAGDVFTGTKARLPNEFFYSAGIEVGIVKRLTAAFDLIGQRIFDGQQLVISTATVLGSCDTPFPVCANPGPATTVPTVIGIKSSYNMTNAAAGLRFNPIGRLLISGNVLVKLDEGGLRANIVPMIAVSYTFK
ncbi:MAG: hypothetical protein WBR10_00755 [Candidatus Acidiferrum sp.]